MSGRLGKHLHALCRNMGGHAVGVETLALPGQVCFGGIPSWQLGHIGSYALVTTCRHKPLVDHTAVPEDQRASRRLHLPAGRAAAGPGSAGRQTWAGPAPHAAGSCRAALQGAHGCLVADLRLATALNQGLTSYRKYISAMFHANERGTAWGSQRHSSRKTRRQRSRRPCSLADSSGVRAAWMLPR